MQNKFINRQDELNQFNSWYQEKKSHLIIVYGKRRVGKTELIKQFIKNKNAIYYLFDRRPEKTQLQELGKRIGQYYQDPLLAEHGFNDWLKLFSYLKLKTKQKRLILTLDEYPYAVDSNAALSSLFQKGWDEYLKQTQTFLILCGSSISMMERETLAYKSPLYGRRTGQVLIHPLNFYQAWQFYPRLSFEEFLPFYTVLGGQPAYLLEFDAQKTLLQNLKTKFFIKENLLFQEIPFLLREEFRQPRIYLSILQAIAYGKTKFGEIINEAGLERGTLYKYLGILEELKIIQRQLPVTIKNPHKFRRSHYSLNDNLIKSWFKFINPFLSELELNDQTAAIKKFKHQQNMVDAATYEQILPDIYRQNKTNKFTKLGRWWDGNHEIDLVGLDEENNYLLVGEAKWQQQLVDLAVYQRLQASAEFIKWGNKQTKKKFVLFSKVGFTRQMITIARKEKVELWVKDQVQ